jgi:hypothetical protein
MIALVFAKAQGVLTTIWDAVHHANKDRMG